MARRFDSFIDALAAAPVGDRACNQYSRTQGDTRGNAIRRRNLRLYLRELDEIGPETLLVGEAPSHRGGRVTGIAFVSERVMLDGVSIRSRPGHILGADAGYAKATAGEHLTTEASATMVWGTIRELEPLPMLWNAYPFHPFHRGNASSNRVPDAAELAAGQRFLRGLIRLFGFRQIIAIGNQAASSLTRLGIEHHVVRHPSMGGKAQFVAGMARLSQQKRVEERMADRESQIQQIKNGRAMRERIYKNRNQPSGPKPPLPTENAVKLSTVPSSAAEKFNGGRE